MSVRRSTRSKPCLVTPLPTAEPTETDRLYQLFKEYNVLYFEGLVKGFTVSWGYQMCSTSGLTEFMGRRIKISKPIHECLPEVEMRGTLLHEMIHAWLFCIGKPLRVCLGHGYAFHKKMRIINKQVGFDIGLDHFMALETSPLRDRYEWQCQHCGHIARFRVFRKLPDPAYGRHPPCPAKEWHLTRLRHDR